MDFSSLKLADVTAVKAKKPDDVWQALPPLETVES